MEEKKLILGYWAIRGIAQPIRDLLEYLGLEYEDRRYKSD
jgi:glutathione S-transferase